MADNQNKQQNHECKCDKALKKQIADLTVEVAKIRKEVDTLRKAVRK